MPMSAPVQSRESFVHQIGRAVTSVVQLIGDIGLFSICLFSKLFRGLPSARVFVPLCFQIGVRSVSVIMITGGFIGMVMAVQSYNQFRLMHMENRMGAMITLSIVTELGPVLAATMLSGRIGSAIAAELGTMKVTEQLEALRALGANPVQYLVVPRLLACLLMIPLLTAVADATGILSGWLFSTEALGINSFHYWHHVNQFITAWDLLSGLTKSIFFGAIIAIIACHRGFNSEGGAEGVGRAATEAFVYSFVTILVLDFFLGVFSNNLYYLIWPNPLVSG
ncbi:MAG: ABC transporter permease [Planctomycetaceae bacterium]|nr:ABC transporter permease [Planctomycetaceae bacterium]